MEAFYVVMHDANDGPQLAAQALAARTHSSNTNEALLALAMLDRCMRRGDTNFHAEVGKFRFLNEIIKLVSPKYFADRTSPEVRTRVRIFCFLSHTCYLGNAIIDQFCCGSVWPETQVTISTFWHLQTLNSRWQTNSQNFKPYLLSIYID